MWILAIRLLVAAMLFARREIVLDLAAASLNTLGIPMWLADPSVWSTLTVHPTRLARETNVLIHALALAE